MTTVLLLKSSFVISPATLLILWPQLQKSCITCLEDEIRTQIELVTVEEHFSSNGIVQWEHLYCSVWVWLLCSYHFIVTNIRLLESQNTDTSIQIHFPIKHERDLEGIHVNNVFSVDEAGPIVLLSRSNDTLSGWHQRMVKKKNATGDIQQRISLVWASNPGLSFKFTISDCY